jgi:hypothetical protein
LEVNELFKKQLNANKLRGKFWIKDIADLIINRRPTPDEGGPHPLGLAPASASPLPLVGRRIETVSARSPGRRPKTDVPRWYALSSSMLMTVICGDF